MSFAINDTLVIFQQPLSVPTLPTGSNPNQVNATIAPVQLGGVNTVYTTTSGGTNTDPQEIVISGANNRLNISEGVAKIQAIGGGTIIESAQTPGDLGKIINLNLDFTENPEAPYNGAIVDKNAVVTGNNNDTLTINQAAGGQGPTGVGEGFAFYAHGGTGNDVIVGSFNADFLRGGAGNDTIAAYAGNDLIRGGAGSDSITGGLGNDTLYYTSDQMDTANDIFTDFVTGVDKIAIDRSMVSNVNQIAGLGTNTIVFLGSTILTSGGPVINSSDITLI
jgi:Ca2+-binding RTX toxin-like protein